MLKKINLLLISSILSFSAFAQNSNSEFTQYHQLYQMKLNPNNTDHPNFGSNVFFSYENFELIRLLTKMKIESQDPKYNGKFYETMIEVINNGELQRDLPNKIKFVDGKIKISDLNILIDHLSKSGNMKEKDKNDLYVFLHKFKQKDGNLSLKDFNIPIQLISNNKIKLNQQFSVIIPTAGCIISNNSCNLSIDIKFNHIVNNKNNNFSTFRASDVEIQSSEKTHALLSFSGIEFLNDYIIKLLPGKYKFKIKILDLNNPEFKKIYTNKPSDPDLFDKNNAIFIEKEIEIIP